MLWNGDLDELAAWARSPDGRACPEISEALELVPRDQVMALEATLCAVPRADPNDHHGSRSSALEGWPAVFQ